MATGRTANPVISTSCGQCRLIVVLPTVQQCGAVHDDPGGDGHLRRAGSADGASHPLAGRADWSQHGSLLEGSTGCVLSGAV